MDSIKQAQESTILKRASNSAKGRFILQGTSRSAFIFGSFFGAFQVVSIHIYTHVCIFFYFLIIGININSYFPLYNILYFHVKKYQK